MLHNFWYGHACSSDCTSLEIVSPEEAARVVAEVRDRVRERHRKTVDDIADFDLPSLDPLGKARDAADGKTAAIGSVNPRPPGLINNAIQSVKKSIARSLNWFVRDQVDYNRAVVAFMDRTIEALIEQNHNIRRVALEMSEARRNASDRLGLLEERTGDLSESQRDLFAAWAKWRPVYEEKLTRTEIQFFHAIRDLEAKARDREETFRADWRKLYDDFVSALDESADDIQRKLWADLDKLKSDQEKQIHTELRLIRRKAAAAETAPAAQQAPAQAPTAAGAAPSAASGFDYARFEERFRGDEAYVSTNQEFYLPYFEGARRVVDLGCGRGELLALLTERGVDVAGVDLDPEALAACREKGLTVEQADLFDFLTRQADESWDGIVSAHVVEHIPPLELPRLMELAHRKLRPEGVLALETPNPRCLAIFAGDFYLDPTHQRPVPPALLDFLLREAGFGRVETVERHPAVEEFPEIAAMDGIEELRGFRERFFGGLDYAIIARKIDA